MPFSSSCTPWTKSDYSTQLGLITNPVLDTNDEGLRHSIYEHQKVFAKFTAEDCVICKLLVPGFVKFSESEDYRDIQFVRLSSEENPVAKQLMNERAAPFFVSYCQGRLLECDSLTTEAAVQAQLNRLRAFLPDNG